MAAALALLPVLAGITSAAPSRRSESTLVKRDPNTFPLIWSDCESQVDALTVNLNAAIAAAPKVLGKVHCSVLSPFLVQLDAICVTVAAEINAIAGLSLDVTLLSDGSVLTLSACATIVARICLKIILILQICINAVALLEITCCLSLVLQVNVDLAAWLGLCFTIIVGLQVLVVALIPVSVITWLTTEGCVALLAVLVL